MKVFGNFRNSLVLTYFILQIFGEIEGCRPVQASSDPVLVYRQLMDRVQRNYVEPVSTTQLLEGSLQGMVESLDPHSTYYSPEKFKEIQRQTGGTYGGLGLEIIQDEEVIRIVSVIDEGPGSKAGLQPRDFIIAINHEPIYGLTIQKASDKLKGEPGTSVTLTIKRERKDPFDVTLQRELVKHHPIKSKVISVNKDKGIGYVRISTFNDLTTQEMRQALYQFLKNPQKIKGVIFDIRNNSGGLLEQAVSTSNELLSKGIIVTIKNRDSKKDITYRAKGEDILKGLPVVVLINAGSASAAEIFAGALQDNQRALIVGTPSFGKGSVQTVFSLPQGGAIKLTTAYYYTPSGQSIQKRGIIPDITVEQLVHVKTLDDTHAYRESNLRSALGATPASITDKEMPSSPVLSSKKDPYGALEDITDYQLEQAVKIIQALELKKSLPALELAS